jgi:hypothetical protein
MHFSAHLRRAPAAALPAAALTAVALAACGGGGANTNTSSASGAPGNGAHMAYEYATCMRNHGLAGFPDPIIHTSANSVSVGIRVTPAITSSPKFGSAQKACAGILPQAGSGGSSQGGPSRAEFVAFAECLRSHGYPTFPDPNSQGQLNPAEIQQAGINVNAPGFLPTARGCLPALKGSVTPAQLARAIKHLGSAPSNQPTDGQGAG